MNEQLGSKPEQLNLIVSTFPTVAICKNVEEFSVSCSAQFEYSCDDCYGMRK